MSQLNSVWVFSDNPERYAELFGGAQQWGQQVYAIVQNTDQAQTVMPYGPECIYVLEQNDALQRTENYAESIAALLKDKHPAMLLLAGGHCRAGGTSEKSPELKPTEKKR